MSRPEVSAARWALLIAVIAMAAALVATAWVSYAGVGEARKELARGHAAALLDEVERGLRGAGGPPDQAMLSGLYGELSGRGLRYLAFVDAERTLEVGAAGSGERFEGELPPPPPRGPRPPPQGPGRGGPPRLIIEIAPVGTEIAARAARTFAVACGAAALLVVAAGVAFRWLSLRERDAGRRERERQLATLGEMSAVLAHELKNPLASLKGNAQLVAESAVGTPEEARAARVVAEAVRLEELTRDLLAFVKTGEIRRREVAPAEVLRGAADEVAPGRIDVDAGAAPARWSLDDGRLRQALVNVLRNAIDAAPGERVGARVWSEGGRLRLEVRDHGAGLEAGQEGAIFEPFHTTKVHGTGLGLAVARRIVELHGGRIQARNHPGGGAVFDIAIPEAG